MINEYKREATRQELIDEVDRLQKENEELNYKYHKSLEDIVVLSKNSIPKEKIENLIQELKKQQKQELKGTKGQDRYYIKQMFQYRISVLQELLEEVK